MQTRDLNSRLVVCIGNSLVLGNFSFNFVDLLKKRLETEGFQFINAGVGGDFAYNVLQRLDSTINLQPDFVTVLVGTNDIQATITKGSRPTLKAKKLPKNPTLEWYRENLEAIVSKLQKKTCAKIALISIPVLGEDLSSEPNQQVTKYNESIKKVADKYSVNYLPVNEQQAEFLRSTKSKADRAFKGTGRGRKLFLEAVLRHHLLRQSFDEISEKNGLLLTIEGVHLNSRGGAMIADQIESFLRAHCM